MNATRDMAIPSVGLIVYLSVTCRNCVKTAMQTYCRNSFTDADSPAIIQVFCEQISTKLGQVTPG